MIKYLGKIKNMVEAMALAEQVVSGDEIVLITLDELGPNYDRFVNSFVIEVNRSVPLLFNSLQGMLTN